MFFKVPLLLLLLFSFSEFCGQEKNSMCYVFKEIFSSKRLNNEHFSAQHTEPLKCSKCPFLEFKTKNDKKCHLDTAHGNERCVKDQIMFIRKNVDGGQESLEYQDRIVNDLDQGLPEIPPEKGYKSVKDNLPVDIEQTINAKDSNDKTVKVILVTLSQGGFSDNIFSQFLTVLDLCQVSALKIIGISVLLQAWLQ